MSSWMYLLCISVLKALSGPVVKLLMFACKRTLVPHSVHILGNTTLDLSKIRAPQHILVLIVLGKSFLHNHVFSIFVENKLSFKQK